MIVCKCMQYMLYVRSEQVFSIQRSCYLFSHGLKFVIYGCAIVVYVLDKTQTIFESTNVLWEIFLQNSSRKYRIREYLPNTQTIEIVSKNTK